MIMKKIQFQNRQYLIINLEIKKISSNDYLMISPKNSKVFYCNTITMRIYSYLYNDAVTSINDIKNKLQLEFQVDSLLEQKVIEDIENTIHYFKEHHVLKEINE